MKRHLFTALLALVVLTLPAHAAKAPKVVTEVEKQLVKLQSAWDTLKSFQADFSQEVSSKAMVGLPPDVTTGVISVLRPNKLRWESKSDGSFQILSGHELQVVHKNQRGTTLVDIYTNIGNASGAKPLNFLTGKAKFASIYTASLVNQTPETVTLKLVPRDGSRETYIAEIAKDGYFLQTLTTDTEDTTVVMKFSNLRRNLTLDKSLFEYRAQPSDIVHRQ